MINRYISILRAEYMEKKMKKILAILCLLQTLYGASICLYNPGLGPNKNRSWLPYFAKLLKEKGHSYVAQGIRLSRSEEKKYDVIIFWDSYPRNKKTFSKSIFVTLEPPLIQRIQNNNTFMKKFYKVFTWNHHYCNDRKYEKLFYPAYPGVGVWGFDIYQPSTEIQFSKRDFSCMINSHLSSYITSDVFNGEQYSKRKNIATYYNRYHPNQFKLYGTKGWDKMKLKVYKGKTTDKSIILQNHKFCYCYENYYNHYHYISEKIIHCFICECVPIYLGCTNITDYIPKETFIDASKFSSIDEIHRFLEAMDEGTWNKYIKAIRDFKKSEKFKLFIDQYFWDSIANVVFEYLKENNIE